MKEGRFRDDLYYRLNVIPIRLPPLRERAGDLPALMEHFLGSFAARYGRPAPIPPPDLLAAARAYPWPGNVRELRNLCERAVLMGWAAVAQILGAGRAASRRPGSSWTSRSRSSTRGSGSWSGSSASTSPGS